MNDLLIITVVSSVLGTLTFGYLVWLGLGLCKALKDSSRAINWLNGLEEHVQRMHSDSWRELDEMKRVLMQRDDEQHKEFVLRGDEILTEINSLRRDIDRRFDRVYHKLYTEFPQLKEVEQTTDC
jgi:hypothetical protein